MLLHTRKATDTKVRLRIARHLPAREDGAQGGVVRQKLGGVVLLFAIVRRRYYKTLGEVGAQHLLQLPKSFVHVPALVPQRKEERLLEFLLLGEECLGPVQSAEVVPPQTRARRDIGVEQVRARDQRVDSKQPAE